MAKIHVCNKDTEVTIEINDLHAVLITLGLGASTLAGIYLLTRNPQTLNAIAQIATAQGKVLVENGIPV